MLQQIVRWIVLQLVRLFYPRLEIQGLENLPANQPIIFVLNHPNGLLDPLLLIAGLNRQIAFLAKHTLFRNPLGRLCMQAFNALPIYRQSDSQQAGATGGQRERNEQTFALCRQLLGANQPLALFPEGTTHSQTTLLPLRTGAARIALSAEAEANWQLGVQLVPVGLWYQNKALFRSAALVVIGTPRSITEYAEAYSADSEAAIDTLTAEIAEQLATVVLQAENTELLNGIPVLARWTASAGDPETLRDQHANTARLLRAYELLCARDPVLLAKLATQARRYARILRTLGISDPWALELPLIGPWRLFTLLALLLLGLPFASAGVLLSYLPYRLAGVLTMRFAGHDPPIIGTVKLIAGAALVFLGWILAALGIGIMAGGWIGLLVLALAPLLAYIALRWGETALEVREVLNATWVRVFHRSLSAELIERRQALAHQIAEAVTTTLTPRELAT